ncbi:MAG: hypothetical protein EOP88_13265 [Verrucomicrobiaceae bacterium]|nr:MAG: hypothetical protein EOP88_13265 [Verrucomicrobiaceae bacterium]
MPANTSFGRKPGEGTSGFYFEIPTPGAANTTPGYPDLATPPAFSKAGGLYTESFPLDLSAQAGWTIYYTLDGSEPDLPASVPRPIPTASPASTARHSQSPAARDSPTSFPTFPPPRSHLHGCPHGANRRARFSRQPSSVRWHSIPQPDAARRSSRAPTSWIPPCRPAMEICPSSRSSRTTTTCSRAQPASMCRVPPTRGTLPSRTSSRAG